MNNHTDTTQKLFDDFETTQRNELPQLVAEEYDQKSDQESKNIIGSGNDDIVTDQEETYDDVASNQQPQPQKQQYYDDEEMYPSMYIKSKEPTTSSSLLPIALSSSLDTTNPTSQTNSTIYNNSSRSDNERFHTTQQQQHISQNNPHKEEEDRTETIVIIGRMNCPYTRKAIDLAKKNYNDDSGESVVKFKDVSELNQAEKELRKIGILKYSDKDANTVFRRPTAREIEQHEEKTPEIRQYLSDIMYVKMLIYARDYKKHLTVPHVFMRGITDTFIFIGGYNEFEIYEDPSVLIYSHTGSLCVECIRSVQLSEKYFLKERIYYKDVGLYPLSKRDSYLLDQASEVPMYPKIFIKNLSDPTVYTFVGGYGGLLSFVKKASQKFNTTATAAAAAASTNDM